MYQNPLYNRFKLILTYLPLRCKYKSTVSIYDELQSQVQRVYTKGSSTGHNET